MFEQLVNNKGCSIWVFTMKFWKSQNTERTDRFFTEKGWWRRDLTAFHDFTVCGAHHYLSGCQWRCFLLHRIIHGHPWVPDAAIWASGSINMTDRQMPWKTPSLALRSKHEYSSAHVQAAHKTIFTPSKIFWIQTDFIFIEQMPVQDKT